MIKVGKQSIELNNVYVHESGVVVGPKEGKDRCIHILIKYMMTYTSVVKKVGKKPR